MVSQSRWNLIMLKYAVLANSEFGFVFRKLIMQDYNTSLG